MWHSCNLEKNTSDRYAEESQENIYGDEVSIPASSASPARQGGGGWRGREATSCDTTFAGFPVFLNWEKEEGGEEREANKRGEEEGSACRFGCCIVPLVLYHFVLFLQ